MSTDVKSVLTQLVNYVYRRHCPDMADELSGALGDQSTYDVHFLATSLLDSLVIHPDFRAIVPPITTMPWYNSLVKMVNNSSTLSSIFAADDASIRLIIGSNEVGEPQIIEWLSTVYKPYTSVLYKDI